MLPPPRPSVRFPKSQFPIPIPQVDCWNAVDEVLAVQQMIGVEVFREQLVMAGVLRADKDLEEAYPEVWAQMGGLWGGGGPRK